MSSKPDITNGIYFDKSGFGSNNATLDDARKKDKSITMDDVNEFFRKKCRTEKETTGYKQFRSTT